MILVRRAIQYLKSKSLTVERLVVGPLMTSLEMAGFSMTLFAATASQVAALDTESSAPAWPGVSNPEGALTPMEAKLGAEVKASGKGPTLSATDAERVKAAVVAMCKALEAAE